MSERETLTENCGFTRNSVEPEIEGLYIVKDRKLSYRLWSYFEGVWKDESMNVIKNPILAIMAYKPCPITNIETPF